MGLWLDDDTDEEGATPWALGHDLEPLEEWDDVAGGPDGEDGSDRWLDEQLDRLQPRSANDRPEPVGERGGGDAVGLIRRAGAGGGTGGEPVLRRPAPVRPPRRRRADPDAAADLPAAHLPGYRRDRRGTWRYAATGEAVPGARDLTLRSLYRFPVDHGRVSVPVELIRSEAELAWCLAWKHTVTTRLAGGRSITVVRVPRGEWERRADIPFGLSAPELSPSRLLAVADVARLARVSPATITAYLSRRRMPPPVMRLGPTPVWSRPVIAQWMAARPGQGVRRR